MERKQKSSIRVPNVHRSHQSCSCTHNLCRPTRPVRLMCLYNKTIFNNHIVVYINIFNMRFIACRATECNRTHLFLHPITCMFVLVYLCFCMWNNSIIYVDIKVLLTIIGDEWFFALWLLDLISCQWNETKNIRNVSLANEGKTYISEAFL